MLTYKIISVLDRPSLIEVVGGHKCLFRPVHNYEGTLVGWWVPHYQDREYIVNDQLAGVPWCALDLTCFNNICDHFEEPKRKHTVECPMVRKTGCRCLHGVRASALEMAVASK